MRIAELESALERARIRIMELETALRESAAEEEEPESSSWSGEAEKLEEEASDHDQADDDEIVAFNSAEHPFASESPPEEPQ